MQQVIDDKARTSQIISKEFTLTDLKMILWKRRVLLLTVILGASVMAALLGWLRGPRYTAGGEMQIRPGSASDLKQSLSSVLSNSGLDDLDISISSYTRIIESDKMLLSVVRKLNLQGNLVFLGGRKSFRTSLVHGRTVQLYNGDLNDPYVREAILKIFRKHLMVDRVPRTQMMSLRYESRSPGLSATIVNELINEFIEINFTAHYQSTSQIVKWLTQQMDDLRGQVQTSQDKLVDMQRRLGVFSLDPSHNLMVSEVGDLQKAYSQAAEQRIAAEARYQILAGLAPGQIIDSPTALGSDYPVGVLANLRAQREQAASALSKLTPVYGPNYPAVKQANAQLVSLDAQIKAQEQRVLKQSQDAAALARTTESSAKSMLSSKLSEIYSLRDDVVAYELANQEFQSNRTMYESILRRLREAGVDAGLDAADIDIVDIASIPAEPSSMTPVMLGLVGLVFGCFGGVGLALFLEKLDTTLHSSADVEAILGVPALAIVPKLKLRSSQARQASSEDPLPFVMREPNAQFAESLRVMRTAITLSSTSKTSKVIAITSCQPSEGKSTIALNLASVLAQFGKSVVLVEADMRRPLIGSRLKIKVQHGLSEYLAGLCSLDEVVHPSGFLESLDLILGGTVPPSPSDLLASDAFKEILKDLRARYDYVIVDTPPSLSVTDAAIVAADCDGLIYVVRQGYSTKSMLMRSAQTFHGLGIKLYGFVFNFVDLALPEYYGYYGYYSYEKTEK